MKTDKAQFDAVLSRMLKSPPKKESEIKAERKPKEPKKAPRPQSDQKSEEA